MSDVNSNHHMWVVCKEQQFMEEAKQLASRLSWPLSEKSHLNGLHLTASGLRLQLDGETLRFDFTSAQQSYRRRFGGGQGQALARACLVRAAAPPRIVDATAGMGQDAFVLASLGAEVILVERSPVIASLLHDALKRAASQEEIAGIISRMSLHAKDARNYLMGLAFTDLPDVIYIDPMYPMTQKSARKVKAMRLFRNLVGDDEDAAALLGLSLGRCHKRVVVKRPLKAPCLANLPPSGAIKMKHTRFDLYPSSLVMSSKSARH